MPQLTINLKMPTRVQLAMVFGLAGSGVLLGGALVLYFHHNPAQIPSANTQISKSVLQEADFPVFVPTKLPNGYALSTKSFAISSGVLTYLATGPSGPYTFTQQKKPVNFNIELLGTQGLTDITPSTSNGSPAAIGTLQGRSMAVLLAPETLVTISAPTSNKSDSLKTILAALHIKPAN